MLCVAEDAEDELRIGRYVGEHVATEVSLDRTTTQNRPGVKATLEKVACGILTSPK